MHAHCLSAALAVAALVRDAALEPPAVGMHADTPTDVDMSTVTNFAILSQARSGSTWLNTMLNGQPWGMEFGRRYDAPSPTASELRTWSASMNAWSFISDLRSL